MFGNFRKNYKASNGQSLYKDWHWGITPSKIIKWDDPDYPEGELIECGRLVQTHFREPNKRKDTVIELTKTESNNSHLCFDPNQPYNRLYFLSDPAFAKRMLTVFAKPKYQKCKLSDAAKAMGGKHASNDYPNLTVAPVGILTHVVYACEKKGDGYSKYIHELGEESGLQPALCIDAKGRFWVAGGNYTAPNAGVTD